MLLPIIVSFNEKESCVFIKYPSYKGGANGCILPEQMYGQEHKNYTVQASDSVHYIMDCVPPLHGGAFYLALFLALSERLLVSMVWATRTEQTYKALQAGIPSDIERRPEI